MSSYQGRNKWKEVNKEGLHWIMVIVDLTVAQPTLLGKVGEVEDAVKELEEEKLLMRKDNGVGNDISNDNDNI